MLVEVTTSDCCSSTIGIRTVRGVIKRSNDGSRLMIFKSFLISSCYLLFDVFCNAALAVVCRPCHVACATCRSDYVSMQTEYCDIINTVLYADHCTNYHSARQYSGQRFVCIAPNATCNVIPVVFTGCFCKTCCLNLKTNETILVFLILIYYSTQQNSKRQLKMISFELK